MLFQGKVMYLITIGSVGKKGPYSFFVNGKKGSEKERKGLIFVYWEL